MLGVDREGGDSVTLYQACRVHGRCDGHAANQTGFRIDKRSASRPCRSHILTLLLSHPCRCINEPGEQFIGLIGQSDSV